MPSINGIGPRDSVSTIASRDTELWEPTNAPLENPTEREALQERYDLVDRYKGSGNEVNGLAGRVLREEPAPEFKPAKKSFVGKVVHFVMKHLGRNKNHDAQSQTRTNAPLNEGPITGLRPAKDDREHDIDADLQQYPKLDEHRFEVLDQMMQEHQQTNPTQNKRAGRTFAKAAPPPAVSSDQRRRAVLNDSSQTTHQLNGLNALTTEDRIQMRNENISAERMLEKKFGNSDS